MEADPLAPQPPLPTRSKLSPRQPPRRDVSSKSQKSPYVGVRETKLRRSPPRLLRRDNNKPDLAGGSSSGSSGGVSPASSSRHLVPAVERKSGDIAVSPRKGADNEKGNIAPDGTSAGREGRQFTVAKVGNNGRIFLRPSVRPANQRYPQPNFVFPATPPSTASLDTLTYSRRDGEETSEFFSTQLTPLTDSPSPGLAVRKAYFESNGSSRPTRHRRAISDSTIHEGDTGAFKIVISKPQEEARSKTDEDLNPDGKPLLQVSIPSWKLGTPRFTLRGTPLLRGSSYAGTEDIRSSNASFFRSSPLEMNSLHPESFSSKRPSSVTVPQMMFNTPPNLLSPNSVIIPRFPVSQSRTTYRSTAIPIEPAMFDSLTFSPDCDDRSIVRYSHVTGAVTAATPARLVAEITSPNFLDYELISDFFLTFRAFLDTPDLLRMLIARLRWALSRHDEIGMVVRVRTFVAIRHWILNYFVDDFVVDYHLRVTFCNLINDLVEEVSGYKDSRCRKVQLKILAEMKKCWRRVCALYWDGPEFDASLDPEVPIAPGGIAGHRDPSLDPSFWETDSDDPPHLLNIELPQSDSHPDYSFYADVSKAGHIDTILLGGGERPATPEERPDSLRRSQTSPISIESLDVVSCSFPTKVLRMGGSYANHLVGAHPVDPSSVYTTTDPIAPTPRALTGKRVRAEPSHRRNASLTDSLREHGKTTEQVLYKNAEFLVTLPYAGSLVRGNLLPPSQPFVDVGPPYSTTAKRNTTIFQPFQPGEEKEKGSGSAMSSQGMRKLIGSVRRAVSSRGQSSSSTQGSSLVNIASIGTRGATTNRLPGTAVVPQAKFRTDGVRHPVRVDLLGASASEDFKRAVREDAAAEAEAEAEAKNGSIQIGNEDLDYSAAHLDSSFELQPESPSRPASDAAITTGSKSIVIVDGTYPTDHPTMAGALPMPTSTTEAFADSFMPAGTADPTPPNTPPGLAKPGGTPRRSSFILGHHHKHSVRAEPLPPFIPDLATLGSPGRPSEDTIISVKSPANNPKSPNKPPPSYIARHKRQQSSRSYRSKGSMIHRRWASFQSGFAVESTVKSFDATTTCSEGSIRLDAFKPPPLRVLRRMPGGDLRGAKNVAELDALALHRTRSAGSLTTYSESIRSSYIRSPIRGSGGFVNVVSSDYSQQRAEVLSLGAVAEQAPKHQPSLFSTHSSKPALRASFEAEAQKLAQIPDDVDDDGGVESALLKLEGKFEKKLPMLSMDLRHVSPRELEEAGISPMSTVGSEHGQEDKRKHRNLHVPEDDVALVSPVSDTQVEPSSRLQVPRDSEMTSFFSDASRESYDSTPLLERGLMTDDGHSKTNTQEWANHSILQGPDTPENEMDELEANSSPHPSYEIVNRTESMDNIKPGETVPRSRGIHSFLDVESDVGTDLSSELSCDVIELDEFSPSLAPSSRKPLDRMVEVPPTNSANPNDLPTVDQLGMITSKPAVRVSSEHVNALEPRGPRVWSRKPLPPTPDTTPTVEMYHNVLEGFTSPSTSTGVLRNAPQPKEDPKEKLSVHLPFVLAFDSEILAQQFTLIEKDALNEVDWKELIDMRWKNANTDPRSWVDFLRNSDAHGVEVVIARFNVMVKWVVSEIVLTQELEERARCIIKFLHIAAHCRRYRNFATMSQVAIALTSNEVARLSKTWAMIPPSDMRTMSELESLVSPTKNFYNLRAEMEGGGNNPDVGCIPFVGIYTHDLLFNSQRPSEIASSPSTPPLVNFERCRIAASVVKTLLRLLEASTLYQFRPIEGITERCLWMTALNDDEIRKHSESLE